MENINRKGKARTSKDMREGRELKEMTVRKEDEDGTERKTRNMEIWKETSDKKRDDHIAGSYDVFLYTVLINSSTCVCAHLLALRWTGDLFRVHLNSAADVIYFPTSQQKKETLKPPKAWHNYVCVHIQYVVFSFCYCKVYIGCQSLRAGRNIQRERMHYALIKPNWNLSKVMVKHEYHTYSEIEQFLSDLTQTLK